MGVNTGMRVFFLSKSNKLSAAITVLESKGKSARHRKNPIVEKIIFSMETVNCLTEAVENSGDQNLQLRLSKLYQNMDSVAVISDKTLFDIVTETIDITKDMKYHREKNKEILNQKAKEAAEKADGKQLEDQNDNEYKFELNTKNV